MSAEALMKNGYMDATRSTGLPRDIEYQLFSRVTGGLNRASRDGAAFADLVGALNDNLTLWRTIAMDVVDDANGLPDKLRAQLFYMFEFTQAHTQKVLREQATPEILIEINTAIMAGLRPTAAAKG